MCLLGGVWSEDTATGSVGTPCPEHADALLSSSSRFTGARLLGHLFQRFKLPVGDRRTNWPAPCSAPQLLGLIEQSTQFMDALSELGVILLLFTAGLGTHIRELAARQGHGRSRSASPGAVLPLVVGFAAARFALRLLEYEFERLFIATALMATSVGITASVLDDLGFSERRWGASSSAQR